MKIFESHINVQDLDKSIHFYNKILGLEIGHIDKRGIVFFWVGRNKESMFGIWANQENINYFQPSHIAFSDGFSLMKKNSELRKKNIDTFNFFNNPVIEESDLTIFPWMPAESFFFKDPDGHLLEFVNILDEKPRASQDICTKKEWLSIKENIK